MTTHLLPPPNIYKLAKYGSEPTNPTARLCSKKAAVTAVNINVQMMVVCLEKVKTNHANMTPGTTQTLVTKPTSLTLVTSPGTRATCPIIRLR